MGLITSVCISYFELGIITILPIYLNLILYYQLVQLADPVKLC